MNPIGKQLASKIGFADLYLERYGSGTVEGLPDPDPDLFLIVTIPAYKEPDLADSLNALLSCDPPGVKWEILVNINYPENSSPDVVATSLGSLAALKQLIGEATREDVRIMSLWNPDIPARHAGVGLARKIAMDQAVQRLNSIGREDGVILSFDADSGCDRGFLQDVTRFYLRNPGARTANIYFEHPLSGGFDPRIYRSIAQYELYLRYMRLAIEETGHPHAIHTVGSSFSVRGKTYVRVNGMGRNKAGEDFYFLHKCIQLKNFWEINDTAVRPSVRGSDRVSFGTGASILRLQNEGELEVYDLESIRALKELFDRVSHFRKLAAVEKELEEDLDSLPAGLSGFMKNQHAIQRILAMHHDSASAETFRAKFFAWFNGFMILRYLNEANKGFYVRKPVILEASRLALALGIQTAETPEELLVNFREFEKGRGNRKII